MTKNKIIQCPHCAGENTFDVELYDDIKLNTYGYLYLTTTGEIEVGQTEFSNDFEPKATCYECGYEVQEKNYNSLIIELPNGEGKQIE